ncbi:SDR family NAD(P)-dependent oxidoreductase [Rhodopila sp.]|uniref:SDR family NAD(P)-dependent oxidoreductase n=1 Tax=Rhodopila sp. TaxID=2480087 RepID=UPI003D0AFA2F
MPVSVITGATGGIGRWIASGLAAAGHRVVIIARDPQRGHAAIDWLTTHVPTAQAELLTADLSSLLATRQVAARITERFPAIDVLVNNAGAFRTRRQQTAEGHEHVIAVNHLAPFVLTRALIPALRAAADKAPITAPNTPTGARIVNVGSSTSDHARIDPTDLEGNRRWGMVHAYSQSKLALTMATIGWARRLQDTGVTANVVHPGMVATGLVRARGPIGLAWRAMAPFLLTEQQGADTPLHVALSPDFRAITGAYVKQRRVVPPNRLVQNPALMDRVWSATETLAGP